jgi:heat shock protein HslJ
MSRTARIVLIVIAIVAIVALAVWLVSRSGGGGTPADPLAGSNWQVRSYYNPAVSGGMASPLGGTQLTAEFAGAKVAGSSGCNTYSASYTVDGSSLTIGAVSSTRMACAEPPGAMEQEAAFLAALQSASSFKLGTGVLQILNGQGQVAVDLIPYTPAPTAIPPAATTAAPTDTPVPAAPTATATPTATETPVPGAPVISRFTAEPQGEITLGQCVALAWEVQGQVESVTLSADNKVIMSPAPAAGNTSDCPSRARAVTYILEAKGPGGTARGTQTLNVVEAPTETPVPPTATPEAPVIDSFSVSPGQVEAGACFTISWNASGGVASSRILRDKTVINDNAGSSGQQQDCPEATGGYTYALQVQNAAGQQVTQQQAVNVTEAPPQNRLAGTSWQAQALVDPATQSVSPILPGTTVTMSFSADGKVSGSSGCNTYTSTYVVDGSKLTMTAPIGTKVLCSEPAGIMEQEAAFLTLLPKVGAYAIDGANLSLQTADGKALAQLVAS